MRCLLCIFNFFRKNYIKVNKKKANERKKRTDQQNNFVAKRRGKQTHERRDNSLRQKVARAKNRTIDAEATLRVHLRIVRI